MYFRSRPVFNVTAHLFFQPKEISTDPINCVGNRDEILPMGNLTVCITGVETTKRKAGRNLTEKYVSYKMPILHPITVILILLILLHVFSDSLRSELIILGMLTVDAMRQTYRGFIGKPDKKERTITTTYVLSDEETCSNYSIYMPVGRIFIYIDILFYYLLLSSINPIFIYISFLMSKPVNF